MKKLFFLPGTLLCLSFMNAPHFMAAPGLAIRADSSVIEHQLDGSVNEWPVDKFSSDREAGIDYAIDNDGQNLYLALKIPGQAEQMKIMRMGMSFYIDLKGKHKKNQGIDFPINKNVSNFQGGTMPSQNPGGKPDLKAMRMMLAINLVSLKVFGFSNDEAAEQDLDTEGSARISFAWDSTEMMQIEYILPLKMLGDPVSLDQKSISIGWKVNGAESTTGSSPGGPTGGGRPPSPGGAGGSRPGTVNRGGSGQPDMQKMMKEQEIWTKYTLSVPAALKGF